MSGRWQHLVDEGHAADKSLLLRYFAVLEKLNLGVAATQEDAAKCSIAEGARILPFGERRGVELHLCDESSLMATGTYKDLDACLVTAIARHANLDRMVVSSGGNLGFALSAYGKRAGIGAFFFHPKSTLYKLNADNFDRPGVHLICTDLPEPQVKSLALAFATKYGLIHVPDVRWRLAASAVRAMYLLEAMGQADQRMDVIAQAVCAGYGPAGIYNCFSELSREGYMHRVDVPRFLGFQQEANSPMVRAWRSGEREIAPHHVQPRPEEYIEPGLYNTNPGRNYTRLFDLMRYYGGDLHSLSIADYEKYLDEVVELMRNVGLELTRVPGTDEILEKTGLLTVIGVLKAIDEGQVPPGERVLLLMTGGFRALKSPREPKPDVVVDSSMPEAEWVEDLGRRFGLTAPSFQRISDRLFKP